MKRMSDNGRVGTHGLRHVKTRRKNKRQLVIDSMKDDVNVQRVQLVHITNYTMWANLLVYHDEVTADDMKWNKIIFQYSENLLKFIINTFSNTVPSPDNLRRWKIAGEHLCCLCGNDYATLAHIMAG